MLRMMIWGLMLVGGGTLSICLDLNWFPGLFANLIFHLATLVPGLLLLYLVMRISRNTGRLLARRGREGDIPRLETNKLITSGIYGCMRHPMHLGLLFFPWAMALILGSPTFMIVIAPLETIFMLVMIRFVEEPEAIRKFGAAYREYQEQVPMFNLRSDCWRQLLNE
ncbi:MAG TPA: isoprenylcysteine carboxylmethyltransferase family protein [Chloroflexi bacterium]|nr:MAG: isoprenylcysteine carboxylmethyltransferase family protein [Chloroflexota bacterium]HDN04611.1 isoprenylcysteine carboxylmethyltransferase family protein [Chloroflexota bacterium]